MARARGARPLWNVGLDAKKRADVAAAGDGGSYISYLGAPRVSFMSVSGLYNLKK